MKGQSLEYRADLASCPPGFPSPRPPRLRPSGASQLYSPAAESSARLEVSSVQILWGGQLSTPALVRRRCAAVGEITLDPAQSGVRVGAQRGVTPDRCSLAQGRVGEITLNPAQGGQRAEKVRGDNSQPRSVWEACRCPEGDNSHPQLLCSSAQGRWGR